MAGDSLADWAVLRSNLPDLRDDESASGGISAAGSFPSISAYYNGTDAHRRTVCGSSCRCSFAVHNNGVPAAACARRNDNNLSGRVTTVTTYDNDRASYQLKGQFRDGKKAKILVYTDDVDAQYGDTLDVAGTFSVPSDSYLWNTGSYYKAKGIFLQADTKDYISCTHTENGKLIRALQAYRSRISMRICTLAGTDAGGMVSAMLLGTKETLSEETDALLTHHGIRHVVSVSGLHLVLILSIWGFLCRKLHFHRWLTFGTTAVWTALYALMVGAPISILRAGFMFLMMQSAPLFSERQTPATLSASPESL